MLGFKRNAPDGELAFGKVPAYCRYELFMERYRSAADFIAAQAAQAPRGALDVLDVGSGLGYLKQFCDPCPHRFVGVEFSPGRLERCRALGYEMHALDVDAEPLPFAEGSFDVVVCSHVLEHLAHPVAVLQEMRRVTRPGGLLILAVPVKPPGFARLVEWAHRHSAEHAGDTVNAFTAGSFSRFAQQALPGTTVVDLRGFRLISARKRTTWENHRGFYRFNTWFGRTFPSWTREVNLVLRNGDAA